jgi:hypothetical protein
LSLVHADSGHLRGRASRHRSLVVIHDGFRTALSRHGFTVPSIHVPDSAHPAYSIQTRCGRSGKDWRRIDSIGRPTPMRLSCRHAATAHSKSQGVSGYLWTWPINPQRSPSSGRRLFQGLRCAGRSVDEALLSLPLSSPSARTAAPGPSVRAWTYGWHDERAGPFGPALVSGRPLCGAHLAGDDLSRSAGRAGRPTHGGPRGEVHRERGNIHRFVNRDRFASWNGTAPLDASSGAEPSPTLTCGQGGAKRYLSSGQARATSARSRAELEGPMPCRS